ncbi:GAF domain-containing protein [Streptomyces sp. NPDC101249]|uniref:GAF domain-containing sensor histidine kinase n=3 Tax=unclassified Streptomyces TaxID=2593676 RepID=UPI00380276C4
MAEAGRGSGKRPVGPRLEELLNELQTRINTVRGTRERVYNLLDAVLTVGRELDLSQVLRRIVETAVVLVDAEYGALGVISAERESLSEFLTVGMDDAQVARIGALPEGHGILGELIRHPEPLRLAEISDHPASYGFPAGHPPMHSFLGVPIRVRDEVFGNLYLTEKRGGAAFDAEDETVLATLAVAAGVAIENARLYEEARRRQRWLEANAEVTRALLSGDAEARALELIVSSAREILQADLGALALPIPGSDELQVVLAVGLEATAHRGLVLPRVGSFMGAACAGPEPITTADAQKDPRITAGPPRWAGLGPAAAVRMETGTVARGVLLLARASGRAVFTPTEVAPLRGFAGQAALALELADRRQVNEQLALFEDRDRIARDLHDLAIQRLFATGMTLQSTVRFVSGPEGSERLLRAVDDLDETIKIIRSTIFGLRSHDPGTGRGLRVRAVKTVDDALPTLGFTPSLRMEGLLDTDVPADVADHAVAVLVEALANVARHADARAADLALVARSGELTVTVTDDGRGIPPGRGRSSGLRNLSERAQELGGALTVERPDGGGTRLVWRVPLPHG